jgi:hypothetical protein
MIFLRFWVFLNVKNKKKINCNGHFGKVTKTNNKNSAFAVRLWGRMAKMPFIAVRFWPRRTSKRVL